LKPNLVEVKNRRQLRSFITFPEKLYKGCANWVPALREDEFDTLCGNMARNAAMQFCERILYLAYDAENKIVGRVAGIINHKANREWKTKIVRFGWIEFINDEEVARSLICAVRDWGKKKGMEVIKGPLGFTDMDREGMLVEGFEHFSPFTCIYNFPYYPEILERIGFAKDADWTQRLVEIPSEMPKALRHADRVEKQFGIHILKVSSVRELGKKYGRALFHMVNESFAPLYQFSPLTDYQIDRYIQTYVPIMDLDFDCVVVDGDNKPVGFSFCVPSLAGAVKKSGGRLFPFGFVRILHALKKNDTLEALMIGITPEFQGMGAAVLMFRYLQENCIRRGISKIIVNPMLENNVNVQSIWNIYPNKIFLRRRSYSLPVNAL